MEPDRGFLVDHISVNVMFDHESIHVPPVVKDLGAEDVPTQTPDELVSFLHQPVVAHGLRVHVVDLEAAVVDVRRLLSRGELDAKQRVVVDQIVAAVDVGEHSHVDRLTVRVGVENIGRNKVEVFGVKVHHGVKVVYDKTIVAELRKCQI